MIDATVPISPMMTIFPGDPGVSLDPVLRMANGDAANVSRYCLGSHTGTHIDPPCHFVPGGLTVDQLPLAALVGRAFVADLRQVRAAIGYADLEAAGVPAGAKRLLLKTSSSAWWADPCHQFHRDYVCLAPDGARWVVERGISLVGIDYLSIEAFQVEDHPVHRTLLGAGTIVVEGLDLRQARNGDCHLICLPLKVAGGDGGPARVILGDLWEIP